jgi:hypothetical protein
MKKKITIEISVEEGTESKRIENHLQRFTNEMLVEWIKDNFQQASTAEIKVEDIN